MSILEAPLAIARPAARTTARTLAPRHFIVRLISTTATILAALIAALAFWARRSDHSIWQSTATIIAAVALALLLIVSWLWVASSDLMFWGVLWAGLVCAIVSLWAALYRPSQDTRLAG